MNLSPNRQTLTQKRILNPVPSQSPPSFLIQLTPNSHTLCLKSEDKQTQRKDVSNIHEQLLLAGSENKQKETKSSKIQKLSSSHRSSPHLLCPLFGLTSTDNKHAE